MKILVLGNGFDLDYNLPTSYMDFLNFCNYVLMQDNPESTAIQKLTATQKKYAEELKKSDVTKENFIQYLKNNCLLKYFNNKAEKRGENWIDFEREIKEIITEFKILEFELAHSNNGLVKTNITDKPNKMLQELGLDDGRTAFTASALAAIHATLCNSLEKFSKALECYINRFVNATPLTGICPDIIDFCADKILTFNYSNTYERIYSGVRWGESIHHVHGVATAYFDDKPNIILGITSQEEKMQNYYVEFEKYFQRITKKTGNEYKKWLQPRRGKKEKIEVMFFGHSLDSMDSDIVNDLIDCESSIITIVYFTEENLQQIVANLIEIVGKGNLINYVYGSNPKIKFVRQRDHCDANTAGVEIARDIHEVYEMHNFNKDEMNALLGKIKNKIETTDLSYFYSQRKVISLFEALKYYCIDYADIETFYRICEKLDYETDKEGALVAFSEYEWCEFWLFDGEEQSANEIVDLVRRVNSNNLNRFKNGEQSKIYAKLLTAETINEIKKELIEIFNEENPCKKYWNQLSELVKLMCENELFKEALNTMDTTALPVFARAKLKHFDNVYSQYCFDLECNKQATAQKD